jgi:hypothetical protein
MTRQTALAAAALMLCFAMPAAAGPFEDAVAAHMWINLSAMDGDATAVKLWDDLAKTMPPAQIAEAQKLAREWKPSK